MQNSFYPNCIIRIHICLINVRQCLIVSRLAAEGPPPPPLKWSKWWVGVGLRNENIILFLRIHI